MFSVLKRTLQILQDRLENTVSIHRATLSPTSRRHYDEAKDFMEREQRSETDSDECCNGTDNGFVVDVIVRHIGSGPRLGCALRRYGYEGGQNRQITT